MHELTKAEQFTLVEDAVKTGVAPADIAAAFNELTALREELKKLGEPESYYLKAMNCPHHHRIFAAEPRSYRDLPLRLAEYGTCYRYEQSGELFGLMRVRSLNMNDAHIYCTPEQFAAEFNAVNEMYLKYFKIFGIEKYVMRFSTHDPSRLTGDNAKFVNEPELWKQTEDMVRQTLIDSKIPYVEVPNEAAFYGPKIDVQVWSVIGREFTLATNQVDFAVPKRFGLVYRDKDNTDKTPLCIHRAPLGTHERFIGFLIEHYAGNFPLWLAPEQVRVLTIGEEEPLVDYAKNIVAELRANFVRAEGDFGIEQDQRQNPATPNRRRSTRCWSSAAATWKPEMFPFVCTAKATSARSRRAKLWRIFWRASKNGAHKRSAEHCSASSRSNTRSNAPRLFYNGNFSSRVCGSRNRALLNGQSSGARQSFAFTGLFSM